MVVPKLCDFPLNTDTNRWWRTTEVKSYSSHVSGSELHWSKEKDRLRNPFEVSLFTVITVLICSRWKNVHLFFHKINTWDAWSNKKAHFYRGYFFGTPCPRVCIKKHLRTSLYEKLTNSLMFSRYNERKGFFCLTSRMYNGHSCLGISKGRKYPPMTRKAEEYLKNYYREPNRQLAELLHKIRQPLPLWLLPDVVQ